MKLCTIALYVLLTLSHLSPYVHPREGWLWAVFGLLYPLILSLCIVGLNYWFLKRSFRWVFATLLFIGVGGGYFMRFLTYNPQRTIPKEANSLKVVSNNVQIFDLYADHSDTKFATRDSIFDYILDQDADVVCFQEFYSKDHPTSFQTDELFERQFSPIDRHQRYVYKPTGRQYFGIVLFSKLPIITKGDVSFNPEDQYNHNFCIFVDVVKNRDTFRIYNVHLQSFRISFLYNEPSHSKKINGIAQRMHSVYPQRADQAIRITQHIESSPYPVIICGDFNDTPVSYVYRQFDRLLTDAFMSCGRGLGITYAGKIPAGRIDYIFHSPELNSYQFETQQNPFSDHRAISCIITN